MPLIRDVLPAQQAISQPIHTRRVIAGEQIVTRCHGSLANFQGSNATFVLNERLVCSTCIPGDPKTNTFSIFCSGDLTHDPIGGREEKNKCCLTKCCCGPRQSASNAQPSREEKHNRRNVILLLQSSPICFKCTTFKEEKRK